MKSNFSFFENRIAFDKPGKATKIKINRWFGTINWFIITDTGSIKSISKENYMQLDGNKFENLEEMQKFLVKYN